MSDGGKTIFNDRRGGNDRRRQDLPMPAGLDRRQPQHGRRSRNGQFNAQPWWLSIDYAVELISEKDISQQKEDLPNKSTSTPNATGGRSSK